MFLNPDYLVNGDVTVLQTFRIALCAVALLAPAAVLCVFLPHKRTSRWKLPLRIMLQIAAVGMLALNTFAWVVRDSSNDTVKTANAVLSYIMLAVAWLVIATMAVFFFIFVGFRGAQLQKKREDLAESILHEEEAVATSRTYIQQRRMRRIFAAWRDDDITERTLIGRSLTSELSVRSRHLNIQKRDITFIQFENPEISGDSGSSSTTERRSSLLGQKNSSLSNKLGSLAQRVRSSISSGFQDGLGTISRGKLGANSPRAPLDVIDDVEMEARDASLRWLAHKDDTTGARYYCNAGTGESRWSLPLKAHPLPAGWTEHLDPSSVTEETAYYLHTPTGATTYDHPGFNESDEALGLRSQSRSESSDDPTATTSGALVGTLVGDDSDEDELIRIVNEGRKKEHVKGVMRWKFVEHASISLARGLLRREGDDGDLTSGTAEIPEFLANLLHRIFTDSDLNDSGTLTERELTAMLKNRAKGGETKFSGLRAIFAEQSNCGKLQLSGFERGVVLEMARDGNGATAQWILNELMDAAALWFEHRSDEGDLYWEHSRGEAETTWFKPLILAELTRVRGCIQSLEVEF